MSCPYLAEKDGDWYCTSKGGYVSYDSYCSWKYDECTYYNGGSSGGGGSSGPCFLTLACVLYKNRLDNCYELTILRKFRDNYLNCFDAGRRDVEEYYKISPRIVKMICENSCANSIFNNIYNMILKCVEYIEKSRYEDAHKCYKDFVNELQAQFE